MKLTLEKLIKNFQKIVLNNVSFLTTGEIVLVGRNGSGENNIIKDIKEYIVKILVKMN